MLGKALRVFFFVEIAFPSCFDVQDDDFFSDWVIAMGWLLLRCAETVVSFWTRLVAFDVYLRWDLASSFEFIMIHGLGGGSCRILPSFNVFFGDDDVDPGWL